MESYMLFAAALLAFATLGSADDAPYVTDDTYPPPAYNEYQGIGYNSDDTYEPTYAAYPPAEYPPPGDAYPPTGGYYVEPPVGYSAIEPELPDQPDVVPENDPNGDGLIPPPDFVMPEVVFPSGYGQQYGPPPELARLWRRVWSRVHALDYFLKIVEDYRNDITAQTNKLSQKVFGWCRSKKNTVLSYKLHNERKESTSLY